MKIHLICTGNTFRSRLAEAYLKYQLELQNIKGVEVSSSGTNAEHDTHGFISWYTLRILHNEKLEKYMSPMWVQTTKEMVEKNDWVILMTSYHLDYCQNVLGITPTNYLILDIEDVNPSAIMEKMKDRYLTDFEIIRQTDEIYKQMRVLLDKLLLEITRPR